MRRCQRLPELRIPVTRRDRTEELQGACRVGSRRVQQEIEKGAACRPGRAVTAKGRDDLSGGRRTARNGAHAMGAACRARTGRSLVPRQAAPYGIWRPYLLIVANRLKYS